ncbi:MAG: glycoside hydrolase family 88 protein, partial [Candidatus Marinimicrobia bacterium]|nr:glycoside hydrolase family 88 protein [Candidatus Neomarinimicrobiota bacterium]
MQKNRYLFPYLLIIVMFSAVVTASKSKPESGWSARMAESVIQRHPQPWLMDDPNKIKWEYTYGLVLKAILEVWEKTGEQKYLGYVESYYEYFIDDSARILTYRPDEYNIDR